MTESVAELVDPVRRLPTDRDEAPVDGVAVCLSGGGYRAMLFHTGVLWRLAETRRLHQVNRIASVSGGSMTAGVLAKVWTEFQQAADPRQAFADLVVAPIRSLASRTIDQPSVISGLLSPFTTIG